jgi:hypothetical protein
MYETSTSKHPFSLPQCRLKDWKLGLLKIPDDPEVQFRDVLLTMNFSIRLRYVYVMFRLSDEK